MRLEAVVLGQGGLGGGEGGRWGGGGGTIPKGQRWRRGAIPFPLSGMPRAMLQLPANH